MIMIFTIRHFVLFLYAGSTHWMIVYIYIIYVFLSGPYLFEQKMLQALLKLGGWLYSSRGGVKIYKFFFKKMTKSNFYFCLKLIIIIIKKEIWSQRFIFLAPNTHTARNFVFKKRNISLKKEYYLAEFGMVYLFFWVVLLSFCTTFIVYTELFLSITQYLYLVVVDFYFRFLTSNLSSV